MSDPPSLPEPVIEYPSALSRPRKSAYLIGWISLGLFLLACCMLGTCFLIGHLASFENDETIWITISVIGFLGIVSLMTALSGLILGIVGISSRRVERVVAVQGLCLNAGFLIGVALYVIAPSVWGIF